MRQYSIGFSSQYGTSPSAGIVEDIVECGFRQVDETITATFASGLQIAGLIDRRRLSTGKHPGRQLALVGRWEL